MTLAQQDERNAGHDRAAALDVSVIDAVIGAAIAKIASQALNLASVPVAAISIAAFLGSFVAHWRYQTRVLAEGTGLAPEFPHTPAPRRGRSTINPNRREVIP